jgi:hypothetical protein
MWAFCCTPTVSDFPFSLDVKERFGSFDETTFLNRLDAQLSSGTDVLFCFNRVDGPLGDSRLDDAIGETDLVASVNFPCFIL